MTPTQPPGFIPDTAADLPVGFEADTSATSTVNTQAKGGDTIRGRDPNADQSVIERVIEKLRPLANPQSGLDFLGLGGLSSAPVAAKLLPGTGRLMEKIGGALERAGVAMRPAGTTLGGADVIGRGAGRGWGGLAEGAAVAASPYLTQGAGKVASATGRALQRTEPLVTFGGPVERTLAASAPVAAESAGPVAAATSAARTLSAEEKQAVDLLVQQGHNEADVLAELDKLHETPSPSVKFTPKAIKAKMNAAETKEYLRLVNRGTPPDEAVELVKAQNAFVTDKGLKDTATVKQKIRERNASGRWED